MSVGTSVGVAEDGRPFDPRERQGRPCLRASGSIYAIALALDDEVDGAMLQPVHGGRGHQRVGKHQRSLVEVAVGGDHRGVALIAVADYLIQILLRVLGQWGEPEIVQDKESHGPDLVQPALVASAVLRGVLPSSNTDPNPCALISRSVNNSPRAYSSRFRNLYFKERTHFISSTTSDRIPRGYSVAPSFVSRF